MNIRSFMQDNDINYLLVNSTNEFLVEYNALSQNSRYKLTGFTGSTGEALVTPETIYLFVDGRYHIQADCEVNHDIVSVVKLQTGQNIIVREGGSPASLVISTSRKRNACQGRRPWTAVHLPLTCGPVSAIRRSGPRRK